MSSENRGYLHQKATLSKFSGGFNIFKTHLTTLHYFKKEYNSHKKWNCNTYYIQSINNLRCDQKKRNVWGKPGSQIQLIVELDFNPVL